jgi:hypothetical protein
LADDLAFLSDNWCPHARSVDMLILGGTAKNLQTAVNNVRIC